MPLSSKRPSGRKEEGHGGEEDHAEGAREGGRARLRRPRQRGSARRRWPRRSWPRRSWPSSTPLKLPRTPRRARISGPFDVPPQPGLRSPTAVRSSDATMVAVGYARDAEGPRNQRDRQARWSRPRSSRASRPWRCDGLADHGRIRDYRKGTYLCHQGDPADEIFFLLEGRVEIGSVSVTGNRVLHATVDTPAVRRRARECSPKAIGPRAS